MSVNIAVLKETRPHERRVALVPAVAARLAARGARLHLESGAGEASGYADGAYHDVAFGRDRTALVRDADVVLAVQPPPPEVAEAMRDGAMLVSFVHPHRERDLVMRLLARRVTAFAMERIPRVARAQAMDALSSQSALAGYYAVMLGATTLGRLLPKLATAAGPVGPARVLVLGLGVAGLEAVATAHRLGALVEGYDVRAATRAPALARGATFVDSGIDATGSGGYARALTAPEEDKAATVLTPHLRHSDLVIATAAVPGRAAPKLVSSWQLAGMKPGAVIVDLCGEGGGNCVDTRPGETTRLGAVTLLAPLNVPSLLAEDASLLYAKNQYNLLELMLKDDALTIDWSDDILAETVLTHAGILIGDLRRAATPATAPRTPDPYAIHAP